MKGPGCEGCTRPVCACELADELRASLAAGEMTERFAVLAEQVCAGYFSQRSLSGYPSSAKQDFQSRFRLRLVRGWQAMDPEQNAFAYLSRMACFAGLDCKRTYDAQRRQMARLRENGLLAEDLERPGIQ